MATSTLADVRMRSSTSRIVDTGTEVEVGAGVVTKVEVGADAKTGVDVGTGADVGGNNVGKVTGARLGGIGTVGDAVGTLGCRAPTINFGVCATMSPMRTRNTNGACPATEEMGNLRLMPITNTCGASTLRPDSQ